MKQGEDREAGDRGDSLGESERGWAGSRFGWYDWEMMGILPGPAKQSVMFSLTTGDCQRGGTAGTESV